MANKFAFGEMRFAEAKELLEWLRNRDFKKSDASQNVKISFNETASDHEKVTRALKNTLYGLGFRSFMAGNIGDKDILFERDLGLDK